MTRASRNAPAALPQSGARRPLVVGNWKMNGNVASNEALLAALAGRLKTLARAVDMAVCPPFLFVAQAAARLKGSGIGWGGQNLAVQESGAFTGEVSAAMLRDVSCQWVIVGHSERRTLFGESNSLVADKCARALAAGLTPIACVGETLAQRESNETAAVIDAQVAALVPVLKQAAPTQLVIAYEPVWAIGTGKTATPEQAQAVHAQIRAQLAAAGLPAQSARLLYGGSVKANNAESLFAQPDIDGGLIGGAALDATEFAAICAASAQRATRQ